MSTRTRRSQLMEKLYELNARALGEVDAPNGRSTLSLYAVNGRVIIVQLHAEHDAWEIFAPLSPSVSIETNLHALEEFARATV